MQQKLEHEGEELKRMRRMNQDLHGRQANELSRLRIELRKQQNALKSGDSAEAAKAFQEFKEMLASSHRFLTDRPTTTQLISVCYKIFLLIHDRKINLLSRLSHTQPTTSKFDCLK